MALAPAVSFAKYSGGTGEPDDPYQISSKADLLLISSDANDFDKCFIMIDDINMDGQDIGPNIIARDTGSGEGFQGISFTGTFDGRGHKLTNFTLYSRHQCIGLFGQIGSVGSVKNLGLENFTVSGYQYVGSLAGTNLGSIRDCYSTGLVRGVTQAMYIGGLVGYNSGSIADCYTVPESNMINTGFKISDVGVETHPPDQISGYLVVGGLAGLNSGTINGCYSTFRASGEGDVGGLVGDNSGNISDSWSSGLTAGSSSIAGFTGFNRGSIINCHSTGQVNGSYILVGGFVGENLNSGSITCCYSTGIVNGSSGTRMVGGFVGDSDINGVISRCFSTGDVNVTANGKEVGGFAGMSYASNIINCFATGSVKGSDKVGGLVGRTYHNSTINYCYSAGLVTGSTNVGGLVGVNDSDSNTLNCFWDIETSGQTTSAAGTGQTTAQMKTRSTFTDAGWDFAGETNNGTDDVWFEGIDYPNLNCQNNKPVANAGLNQILYAWIDGFAEVTLNGSASFDADGDALTYLWKWSIDGNDYETNGVNPLIQLPAGSHRIELIVNDGIVNSEPNYVEVNVIEPIKGTLMVMPRVINNRLEQKNILAMLRLPAGINRTQIDYNTPVLLYPGEIQTVKKFILGFSPISLFAAFSTNEVFEEITGIRPVQLYVVGQLKTGQFFYGGDTIRIINPGRPHPK